MNKKYDLHDALDYVTFWIHEYAAISREIVEFGDKYVERYKGKVDALEKLKEVLQFWLETNKECETRINAEE